jgi:hypothetical protein
MLNGQAVYSLQQHWSRDSNVRQIDREVRVDQARQKIEQVLDRKPHDSLVVAFERNYQENKLNQEYYSQWALNVG